MLPEIKKSLVEKLLPRREGKSHKGQNGKVLIVGGSLNFHGAPILAGLGALYSGADLVYLYVPSCNFDVTRGMYPDFIVRKFDGEFLQEKDSDEIISFGKECDSILIGPGIGTEEASQKAIVKILNDLHVPTVLDAEAISALKKVEKFPLQQTIVITPHSREFQNLVDKDVVIDEQDAKSVILLRSVSMDLKLNVLLKGPTDYVSSEEGHVEINHTGNAGMTVGGSGDVLSGVVATFLAQGCEGFDAARAAAYVVGDAGDAMKKTKGWYFSASDIAMAIPFCLNKFL
ncbi:MAG: NAD(P)H-hydrate dehydratase [Candidatus Gracilibacteria bacterium]|jgi:NAD(P)H-hydrate epimerase